jgi:ATP-dependent helicase/nuclease subunit A
MNDRKPLPDQFDRDSAIANHHESIFIDAGAGTGKTETIVSRIVSQIIADKTFAMSQIAAITFTEKAGAELRNRFRRILEEKKSDLDSSEQSRIEEIINNVDSAAIGTIHAFCKSILTDHSIAAKLPVGFKIGSESAGPRLKIQRARKVVDQVFDSFTPDEQYLLRDINFNTRRMEEMVTELDSKFAIVHELSLKPLVDGPNEHEKTVFKFIYEAIRFLKEDQTHRRTSGEIEFDDLLLMTRELLRSDEALRKSIAYQYRVLLVDEFQDTDPVQWEIVRLLSKDTEESSSPRSGSLVLVGDPKQSIYRFRNADLNTFISVKNKFSQGQELASKSYGAIRDLSSNFRSVKPVIEFVNWLFQDLPNGGNNPLNMGVSYKPLNFVHQPKDIEAGPAVRVFINPDKDSDTDENYVINAMVESEWTAKEIRRVVTQKYLVTEKVGKYDRGYRKAPANFGDICILIPVRTKIGELIRALASNNIPFVSADPSIVFSRPLVLGLINALKVVAQTDDDMALWATLKSPLFGLTDEQLVIYKQEANSTWNIDGYASGGEDNVQQAMELFFEVRNAAGKQQPSVVLQEILDRRQIFEKLSGEITGAFEASSLRTMINHAIQWENDGHAGLLEYLDVLEILTDSKNKSLLPMPSDLNRNAVQIMTIHASKGLEFPVTVVTSMSSWPKASNPKILISKSGTLEFCVGKDVNEVEIASSGYASLKETEEKQAAIEEANRLLYVAMTRARDHLIVSSLYRQSNSRSKFLKDAIDLLTDGDPKNQKLFDVVDHSNTVNEDLPEQTLEVYELSNFQTDFKVELETSRKRHVVSPSSDAAVEMNFLAAAKQDGLVIGSGSAKPDKDNLDWERGSAMAKSERDGRPFGRALHGVMDLVMKHGRIPDQETLQAFLWQMAHEQDVLGDLGELTHKINLLLETEVVHEALQAEKRWPELHLAIADPNDSVRLAEGFADLVYKTSTGYVLVDYKTDKKIDLEKRMHYSQQLGAYALILEHLTGEFPERVLLLHVREDDVETIPLYLN